MTETPVAGDRLARDLVATPRTLIVAHRGNSRFAPENSLAAFRSALETGADLVELDYWHSADGVPVVFHDKLLDRTTNAVSIYGKGHAVGNLSFDELSRLDVGSWFSPAFGEEKLPSLQAALEVIQARSTTMIERKGGDAKTLVELLQKREWLEAVVVMAFDWDFLAECRRLAPGLVLGALGDDELTGDRLTASQPFGPEIIAWNSKHLDAASIELIHRAGKKAWTYTVDEPAEAKRLIDAGIDGVISNDPARIQGAL
jgi:glycerophosphoryl diester phosphodiesterase